MDVDSFPLYFRRALASRRLSALTDYQMGWWFRLLLEMARAGGSLPLDIGLLWRLAGARTEQYFRQNCSAVFACYEVRQQGDKKVIFSQLLDESLQVVATQKKGKSKKSRYIDLIDLYIEDLKILFEEGWKNYDHKVGGKEYAQKCYLAAVSRIAEKRQCQPMECAKWLNERLLVFGNSPLGGRAKGKFTPHLSTWLNQGYYDGDEKQWCQSNVKRTREQEIQERIRRARGETSERLPDI